jgi:hypothetical protein
MFRLLTLSLLIEQTTEIDHRRDVPELGGTAKPRLSLVRPIRNEEIETQGTHRVDVPASRGQTPTRPLERTTGDEPEDGPQRDDHEDHREDHHRRYPETGHHQRPSTIATMSNDQRTTRRLMRTPPNGLSRRIAGARK